MKYTITTSLLVAAVYAQVPQADPGIPIDELGAATFIGQSLAAINTTVLALDAAIVSFTGDAGQIPAVNQSAQDVLDSIAAQNTFVAGQDQIPSTEEAEIDTYNAAGYILSLGYFVNQTVVDLVAKKQLFVDACAGPLVQQRTAELQSAELDFKNTAFSKLPGILQDPANLFIVYLEEALSSAVSVFATETILPTSCTSTSTTSSTTSTTSSTVTSSETSTTDSVSGGLTIYPTYPTGSVSGGLTIYPTYPTNSVVYPTYASTGTYSTDDCEDEYPTSSASHAVWEPQTTGYYGSGSGPSSYSSVGSVSYGTGSKSGSSSYPTDSHVPSGSVSYYTSVSSGLKYSTTAAVNPIGTYTPGKNAAVSTNVNFGGAVLAAAALIALL